MSICRPVAVRLSKESDESRSLQSRTGALTPGSEKIAIIPSTPENDLVEYFSTQEREVKKNFYPLKVTDATRIMRLELRGAREGLSRLNLSAAVGAMEFRRYVGSGKYINRDNPIMQGAITVAKEASEPKMKLQAYAIFLASLLEGASGEDVRIVLKSLRSQQAGGAPLTHKGFLFKLKNIIDTLPIFLYWVNVNSVFAADELDFEKVMKVTSLPSLTIGIPEPPFLVIAGKLKDLKGLCNSLRSSKGDIGLSDFTSPMDTSLIEGPPDQGEAEEADLLADFDF